MKKMIKKSILILVVLASIVGCDDIIFTDGRTLAEGYVIDSLTNQKVPNVLVYLADCHVGLLGSRCNSIIDSTRTNADGYYRFRFKDKRKTDFGVGLARPPENNFMALPLVESSGTGQNVIDGKEYLIREGKKNRFDFYVKLFTTISVQVKLRNTGYQDAFLYSSSRQTYVFDGLADGLDTTLQVKVLPWETNYLSLRLTAPGKEDKVIDKVFYVDPANHSQIIME
jgi:hypothetical protein